jgi:hypothetical protein
MAATRAHITPAVPPPTTTTSNLPASVISFSSMGSGLSFHDFVEVVLVCEMDCDGAIAVIAPVAATPLMKVRRSTFAFKFF